MAWYTTEVKTICEQTYLNKIGATLPTPDIIRDRVADLVIPQDFPFWEEGGRHEFCKNILEYYYFREIGMETVALWKDRLNVKLKEIMPKYVYIANAKLSFEDAFVTIEEKKEIKRSVGEGIEDQREINNSQHVTQNTDNTAEQKIESTGNTTANGTSHQDQESTAMESDTPQNGLNDVIAGRYLTRAEVSNASQNTTSNDTSTVTQNTTTDNTNVQTTKGESSAATEDTYIRSRTMSEGLGESVTGFNGDKIDVVSKYRELFVNLKWDAIKELSDLFMTIF